MPFCVYVAMMQVCGGALKSSMAGNALVSESLAGSKGHRISMTATSAPRNREAVKSSKGDQKEIIRVAVLGASGYTGSEVWMSSTFSSGILFCY